jgi:hypothetical protein
MCACSQVNVSWQKQDNVFFHYRQVTTTTSCRSYLDASVFCFVYQSFQETVSKVPPVEMQSTHPSCCCNFRTSTGSLQLTSEKKENSTGGR